MRKSKHQNLSLAIRMILVLTLLAALLSAPGSSVYGEPAGQSDISFSVPFVCNLGEPYCLADPFKAGLHVVLVGKSATCGAKTGKAFTHPHHVEEFEATRLLGNDPCLMVKDYAESFRKFRMAVVGADPAAVRVVSPRDDESPVPKDMELKARKLAVPDIQEPQKISDQTRIPVSLSNSQPKVLRTENVTLLIFELLADGEPWEPGPTVALTNAGIFLLDGACTGEHIFFFLNDKLYVTYGATVACCGCGDTNFFVYELSSGTPKMVYQNSNFSD